MTISHRTFEKIYYLDLFEALGGSEAFESLLRELITDWGVGLGTDLYTEAITHVIGKQERVTVTGSRGEVGTQPMTLLTSSSAFKVTSLTKHLDEFRLHATRLLNQTGLERILWANMTIGEVRLEMIGRG